MFLRVRLFLFSCLFLTIECQTGQVFRPQNVVAVWKSDFEPGLSWDPPQHSVNNCFYVVTIEKPNRVNHTVVASPFYVNYTMEGGFLRWNIETVCNGTKSEPVVLNVTYPELVKNLTCYIHSLSHTYCEWSPVKLHPLDPRFYYEILDGSHALKLKEGLLCNDTSDGKTVCELQEVEFGADIYIVFNGTLNNKLVRNTFKRAPLDHVRPPSLKWNVRKNGDKFDISWTPPGVLKEKEWKFIINYTACNVNSQIPVEKGQTSYSLPRASHCQYNITIRAEHKKGNTPWSDWKHFDKDPNMLVYAAIIVPLVIAILAALICGCLRKHKEHILPKVPEPRNFLKDIPDNNNKTAAPNLYVPAEEEDCKITLVMDPQSRL